MITAHIVTGSQHNITTVTAAQTNSPFPLTILRSRINNVNVLVPAELSSELPNNVRPSPGQVLITVSYV